MNMSTEDLDLLMNTDLHWILNNMNLCKEYLRENRTESGGRTDSSDITLTCKTDDGGVLTASVIHPVPLKRGSSTGMVFTYLGETVMLEFKKDENDHFVVASTAGPMEAHPGLYPFNNESVLVIAVARHLIGHLGVGEAKELTDDERHQMEINAGTFKCPRRGCLWGKRQRGSEEQGEFCKTHGNACRDCWRGVLRARRARDEAREAWSKIQGMLSGLSEEDRTTLLNLIRHHKLGPHGPPPFYSILWDNLRTSMLEELDIDPSCLVPAEENSR